MKFELLRNANVEVTTVWQPNGSRSASIVVNDKYQHTFPSASRISKHLDLMTEDTLSARLSDGSYFFVEDKLVDFRDGQYAGFIHDDSAIADLAKTIGFTETTSRRMDSRFQTRSHNRSDDLLDDLQIVPANDWSDFDIVVPKYADGGLMNTQLVYDWSPFKRFIGAQFNIIRLICENGMVGSSPLIDTKIPMINHWEQHLDIAAKQIQYKINTIVNERMDAMSDIRASVGMLMLIANHVSERMDSDDIGADQTARLMQLYRMIAPKANLAEFYQPSVFDDNRIADQLPSHINCIDAFNIVTELRSHYDESSKSSNVALDRISNNLLFDYTGPTQFTGNPVFKNDSAFATPVDAFYAVV